MAPGKASNSNIAALGIQRNPIIDDPRRHTNVAILDMRRGDARASIRAAADPDILKLPGPFVMMFYVHDVLTRAFSIADETHVLACAGGLHRLSARGGAPVGVLLQLDDDLRERVFDTLRTTAMRNMPAKGSA